MGGRQAGRQAHTQTRETLNRGKNGVREQQRQYESTQRYVLDSGGVTVQSEYKVTLDRGCERK